MMDRAEARLRSSPFIVRDAQLQACVEDIACLLAGNHCPDIRVYLARTPYFNASMAPNGMMQVWSGLMLRADNEAQLAAVLGHEIGHYLERHSLGRLRAASSGATAAQIMGFFGPAGLLGGVAVAAGLQGYSRDHEREADRIGALLMSKAGYDVRKAAKVWENLLAELKARPGGPQTRRTLFATHPPQEERQKALAELAAAYPGGEANAAPWHERIKPFLREWLADEIKRGQREESIAFLTRAVAQRPAAQEYLYARGEVYRLRAAAGDLDAALADFQEATRLGSEPPETHRSLGFIFRVRRQAPEAIASFQRYLEATPQAPDADMIRSYLEELRV